jgi:integrase
MMEISNINFSEKTIEKVEVSGDNIKEILCEFLDNTFRLTIVKNENKEVVTNEVVMEDVVMVEVVKEEIVVEDEGEVEVEPASKKIMIEEVKHIIYENIPKKNTRDTYFRTIKQVYNNFQADDVYELLKIETEIVKFIEEKYEKHSTIKNKLCGMYKVYNLLNIESLLLKDKIDQYMVSLSIQEDKEKENSTDKKILEEAEQIVTYFKNEMDMMEDEIKNDAEILSTWNKTAQLYAVLRIYLTYDMLRPSEIIDIKITDTDEGNDKVNYINVVTKKIVINNHKNDRKGTKTIDITDNELNDILCRGEDKYLITNYSGEIYTSSSSFSKMLKIRFNDYNPYDLRKVISSLAIHEGDTEKINMLEHNQGHSLNTILKNYNTYNKVDV